MRVIWIAPKFPLGPPDGARHATCVLVRSLAQKGVDVAMICLLPKGEQAEASAVQQKLGVSSCALIPRSASKVWPLPGPRTPFTFRTFAAAKVRRAVEREIDRLMGDDRETVLIFDGLHGFAALSETALQAASARGGVVYRAHNHETSLWEQCAQKARWPWSRRLFRHQAALVKTFEQRVAESVDLIAPVSGEDADRFAALAPGATSSVTPIGMEFPPEETVPPVLIEDSLRLLFVGRLDWLPNRRGLRWFLENVWEALVEKRARVTLQVAGTGDGRWLEKFRHLPGLSLLGRVENLQPLYEASALSLAPLFQGSGTRVKILESARYARPVLTTALGAEGLGLTPGVSTFQAEDRDGWLNLLSSVKTEECRETGLNAFREAKERFESATVAEKLIASLKTRRR